MIQKGISNVRMASHPLVTARQQFHSDIIDELNRFDGSRIKFLHKIDLSHVAFLYFHCSCNWLQ